MPPIQGIQMSSYRRNQIIIGGGVLFVILVVAGLFTCTIPGLKQCMKQQQVQKITLEFWNVFETSDVYRPFIQAFEAEHPNVTINYHTKTIDTYGNDLTDAFSHNQGPDIFAMENTWLPLEQKYISPVPSTLLSFDQFSTMFPDVVRFDFSGPSATSGQAARSTPTTVQQGPQIYGLPLFVDTLGLFYNKAYFNSANITAPPATWDDFLADVKKITQYNQQTGAVDLAGASIGTATNINRSPDILSLLMLQTGAHMTDDQNTRATFNDPVVQGSQTFLPGQQALTFYTSFALPGNPAYTWNDKMPYSTDAFVGGNAAMMFNYSYAIPTIQNKNRYLEFLTAPVPQPTDQKTKVGYANYWGLTVSKDSKNADMAWQFILFMLQENNEKQYVQKVQRPTSLVSLIPWQQQNASPLLKPFVDQVLSARSWYEGDSTQTEQEFANAIEAVVSGQKNVSDALSAAEINVNAIFQKVRLGIIQ